MNEYNYLTFIEMQPQPKAKTKIFAVKNKLFGDFLGLVKWHGPWRKYCFFVSNSALVFDAGCLADIKDFIDKLMAERKERNN